MEKPSFQALMNMLSNIQANKGDIISWEISSGGSWGQDQGRINISIVMVDIDKVKR